MHLLRVSRWALFAYLLIQFLHAPLGAQTTEDGFVYQITGDSVVIMGIKFGSSNLIIPAEIEGLPVTSIADQAFSNYIGITSVSIPASVTEIGSSAFRDCSSLTSVDLSEGLQSIGSDAFAGTSLTEVSLPDSVSSIGVGSFGSSKLENINAAAGSTTYASVDGVLFNKDLSSLLIFPQAQGGSYVVPESVTRLAPEAFSGNQVLTSVVLPDGLTYIGAAFQGCSALEEINIPDGVTSIAGFGNCVSLTQIILPDSVTRIGDYAFSGCSSLTSISLGEGVETIGMLAFSGCSSLAEIVIPDSVTSIGAHALTNTGIIRAEIGNGIAEIATDLFIGSSNLKSISFGSNVNTIHFKGFPGSLQEMHFAGDAPENVYPYFLVDFSKIKVYYQPGTAGWDESIFNAQPAGTPLLQITQENVLLSFYAGPDHSFSLESSTDNDAWTQKELINGDGSQVTRTYSLQDIDQPTFFRVRQL